MGRESDVEDIGETLHHHLLHLLAELGGEEAALLELRIATIDESRNDRRVSGRPADAESLQLFDETRLRIPRRRLGEVLGGCDRPDRNVLALFHCRKSLLFLERFPFLGFARFLVQPLIAVKFHDAARRSEQEAIEIKVDGRGVEDRRRHLRSHEALPDQLVKLVLIFLQVFANVLWPTRRIRRTNRLVRILSVLRFCVGVKSRSIGQVLLPVHHFDVVAGLHRC